MTTISEALLSRRRHIDHLKFNQSLYRVNKQQVHDSIVQSWQRSAQFVPLERAAAPVLDAVPCHDTWQASGYGQAIALCQQEINDLVRETGMVAAIADAGSRILWTGCSANMRDPAEQVHFVPNAMWDEHSVGTNALALALRSRQSVCVFSNEHFMRSVQDWVCYAAPIVHPLTGHTLGVIDLSTTWGRHSTLGLLAAERIADRIAHALVTVQQQQLVLHVLGQAQVYLNGKKIVLPPRQLEILCVLALCPQGLSLDMLHQALYGERTISLGTLKTEISQLRDALGGLIGSRPYCIKVPVFADFIELEKALDAGYVEAALRACHGVFMPKTDSPFLRNWRDCIESRLSDLIFKSDDPALLLEYLNRTPEAIDALERLTELLPPTHPFFKRLGHLLAQ